MQISKITPIHNTQTFNAWSKEAKTNLFRTLSHMEYYEPTEKLAHCSDLIRHIENNSPNHVVMFTPVRNRTNTYDIRVIPYNSIHAARGIKGQYSPFAQVKRWKKSELSEDLETSLSHVKNFLDKENEIIATKTREKLEE